VTYANHASAEFNQRLETSLKQITADVVQALGENLVALILGGGYGRGEGGVVLTEGREAPYNDIDFTLVVKNKRAVPNGELLAISERYEALLHVDIDFSRPLTLKDIKDWPHWLMWYDLVNGHVVLHGPVDILSGNAPSHLLEPLPLIEASRYLLNRGAGLLWAMRVVSGIEPAGDQDFVRRNYYKCVLAMGDVMLIAGRRYVTPYAGRDLLLAELAAADDQVASLELGPLYQTSLAFKFNPHKVAEKDFGLEDLKELARTWGKVFLQVENRRTGMSWPWLDDYVAWPGLREPEQNKVSQWPRNFVRNAQLRMWSWRYPREQLYQQLPVLLHLTKKQSTDWPSESARFLAVWHRFN